MPRGVCRAGPRGIHAAVIHSVDDRQSDEGPAPPAERPRGSEEELARGRVEQTPVTVINWVALVIGAFAALVLVLVVVAYVVA